MSERNIKRKSLNALFSNILETGIVTVHRDKLRTVIGRERFTKKVIKDFIDDFKTYARDVYDFAEGCEPILLVGGADEDYISFIWQSYREEDGEVVVWVQPESKYMS